MGGCYGKAHHQQRTTQDRRHLRLFLGPRVMSLAILGFCLAVTLKALFEGNTSVSVKYSSIGPGLAVFLLFFFMSIVGMLEGMQIAFFAVAKLPPSERGTSFFGQKTCDLLFMGNGQNLPGFMIGRQLTVVCSFFLVGSFTSLTIEPGEGNNIFGVRDSSQAFLNYGLQGAVITTILASISLSLPWPSSSLESALVPGCVRASRNPSSSTNTT